jgi:hypothetical protein
LRKGRARSLTETLDGQDLADAFDDLSVGASEEVENKRVPHLAHSDRRCGADNRNLLSVRPAAATPAS